MAGHFKKSMTLEQRREHAQKLRGKYTDRLPVICEKADKSEIEVRKTKFLVPGSMTVGQYLHVIRKHADLTPTTAIYVFVNNTVPQTDTEMRTLYDDHKDEDGFLYVTYSSENTFGL